MSCLIIVKDKKMKEVATQEPQIFHAGPNLSLCSCSPVTKVASVRCVTPQWEELLTAICME